MRGGRRPKAVSVIEAPRSLSSRLLRRAPSTTPVIEEPREFNLRTVRERLGSARADPKQWHRLVGIASVTAGAVVVVLKLSGVVSGDAAGNLLFLTGTVGLIADRWRGVSRLRPGRKRSPDRR